MDPSSVRICKFFKGESKIVSIPNQQRLKLVRKCNDERVARSKNSKGFLAWVAHETLFPFYFRRGERSDKIGVRGRGCIHHPTKGVKRGENLRPLFHLAWPFSIPAQQSSRSENNSDFSFVSGPRTFDTRYTPLMTGLAYLIDDAAEKSIQSALRCLLYANLSCVPGCLVSRNWHRFSLKLDKFSTFL